MYYHGLIVQFLCT